MATRSDFEQRIDRIDTLVERLEAASDPALRATAKELVQSLMDLHGAGLERILTLVHERADSSASLIDLFAGDDLIRSLLLLYGLHPDSVETRVVQALEKSRPHFKSFSGKVELIDVSDDGVVRLKCQGSGDGFASSSVAMRAAIEQSIRELAPEVTAVVLAEESENGNRHFSLPIVQVDAPRRAPARAASGA